MQDSQGDNKIRLYFVGTAAAIGAKQSIRLTEHTGYELFSDLCRITKVCLTREWLSFRIRQLFTERSENFFKVANR